MLNSRLKSLLVIIVLIVVAGGIAAGVVLSNNSKNKKASQAHVKMYSPGDVAPKLPQYIDKKISLKGLIYKVGESDYYVINSEGTPVGVKLDFSQSKLDPQRYANGGSVAAQQKPEKGKQLETKGPFIVTGKVLQPKPDGPTVLLVESVKD